MKAFLNIAEMGRGKTTETIKLIRNFKHKDVYAYDPNGEYKEWNKIKGLPTRQQFIQIVSRVKNAIIIFEESTSFFNNKFGTDMQVIDMLIRNHHVGNVIIMNFHSLRAVPVEIMDYVGFLNIFHTNDRLTLIKNKFRDDADLLDLFNDVYEKTQGTEKNRLTGKYADERSEKYYHFKRVYSR